MFLKWWSMGLKVNNSFDQNYSKTVVIQMSFLIITHHSLRIANNSVNLTKTRPRHSWRRVCPTGTSLNELLHEDELKLWLKLDWFASEVASNASFKVPDKSYLQKDEWGDGRDAPERQLTAPESEETLKHFKWKLRQNGLSVHYLQD